jgi:hypothetical protein
MTEKGATDHAEANRMHSQTQCFASNAIRAHRLGALSRCKPCLRADTARDRNQHGHHGPKIEAAARQLWPDGKIPSWLRPVDIFQRLESASMLPFIVWLLAARSNS